MATVPKPQIIVHCRACTAPLAGPFCQNCGQPSASARRTVREVLAGQGGRLLHTLRIIVTQPGELAREIDEVGINPFGLSPMQIVVVVVGLAYATLTQRRIYAERWTIAALKSAVVVTAGAVVHNLMLIMALVIALLVT